MPFPRFFAVRSLRQVRRLPKSGSTSGQWHRTGKKSYSTASETAQKAKDGASSFLKPSELPWLITSVAITIPGTYWILANGSTGKDAGYPGQFYHGDEHKDDEEGGDDEEEHDEGEDEGDAKKDGEEVEDADDNGKAKEEGTEAKEDDDAEGNDDAKEGEKKGEGKEEGGDEDKGEDEDSKSGDSKGGPSQTKRSEGKNLSEQPAEDKISKKTKEGSEGKFSEEVELDNGDSSSKKIHKPDAKGGAKRRIESGNAKVIDGDQDDAKDAPGSGSLQKSKQKGLSNTETKHSTDPGNDPEKSSKGEGIAETAKIQGTVDSSRPAR